MERINGKIPLEQIKELDAQREQLISEAKDDALTRAEEAIADLNALGFHYYLGETEKRPRPSRRAKQTDAEKSERHKPSMDKPCPICEYRTDPPHDRRSHRMQTKKKAFTDKELEAAGMTRL
jgi:hypothetical protein